MKITEIKETPTKSYCVFLENLDDYYVEIIDDGNTYSSWLVDKTWPKLADALLYKKKEQTTLDEFISSLEDAVSESYIRFCIKRREEQRLRS